ncbi:MAG: response regulator [Deltaproteobacteria bacterium]|nr:response regulator [Deltaproteobacteria bacterium]
MIIENIVPQSAGSLSVAVLALLMVVIQSGFFFRNTQFAWYGWGAAISFSSLLYAIGIFLEYNTPAGSLNRFAGLLELTAVICLIHCFYGFTFSCLGMESRHYHLLAGTFHSWVLILLWSGNDIVADRFVARHFLGLAKPYIEPDLGPLGFLFVLYAALAAIGAVFLWFRHEGAASRHRAPHLAGIAFWILLGIHDGLAALGMPTVQYVMEYGFFGYSLTVLWIIFNNYVDLSAEDKYRVITEFANDGILVIQDNKAVFANRACTALLGRSVIGRPVGEFLNALAPAERPKLTHYCTRLTDSPAVAESLTVRVGETDRAERVVEIRASIIRYRHKPAVLAIMRDISERIREEEALRESEAKLTRLKKMESLGLLAGGVAHDLNNVLSGIVSYPQLILLNLPEDSKLRKPVETIQRSGQRAADIVQDLLTVARGVAIPKEPLNLNELVSEYLKSPEYRKLLQYHPAVSVRVELEPRLANIRGSAAHIQKVVMNLVSNASEAIDGAGTVVLSTLNRYVDRPLKGYEEVNVGEYVVLSVADSGPGISAEDLQRIFEPFYTKKVMGRSGTGLGLTVVWNVIQDHDGYIDVLTDKDGSRFELYFPVTGDSVKSENAPVPLEDLYGRGETVLVIDDLKNQREITCQMLEALQYQARAVSGGEEAIQYLREHRVDVLILDMIMDPGINGRETYRRIKQLHPRQKAIIVSGFAETEQVKETLKSGAGRYLKKPFVLEELGLALKEELRR